MAAEKKHEIGLGEIAIDAAAQLAAELVTELETEVEKLIGEKNKLETAHHDLQKVRAEQYQELASKVLNEAETTALEATKAENKKLAAGIADVTAQLAGQKQELETQKQSLAEIERETQQLRNQKQKKQKKSKRKIEAASELDPSISQQAKELETVRARIKALEAENAEQEKQIAELERALSSAEKDDVSTSSSSSSSSSSSASSSSSSSSPSSASPTVEPSTASTPESTAQAAIPPKKKKPKKKKHGAAQSINAANEDKADDEFTNLDAASEDKADDELSNLKAAINEAIKKGDEAELTTALQKAGTDALEAIIGLYPSKHPVTRIALAERGSRYQPGQKKYNPKSAISQYVFALHCMDERNGTPNYPRVLRWLERAANQNPGLPKAEFLLGFMYAEPDRFNNVVKGDPQKAMGLFNRAAAQGEQATLSLLANYHLKGSNRMRIKQNPWKAKHLLGLVAAEIEKERELAAIFPQLPLLLTKGEERTFVQYLEDSLNLLNAGNLSQFNAERVELFCQGISRQIRSMYLLGRIDKVDHYEDALQKVLSLHLSPLDLNAAPLSSSVSASLPPQVDPSVVSTPKSATPAVMKALMDQMEDAAKGENKTTPVELAKIATAMGALRGYQAARRDQAVQNQPAPFLASRPAPAEEQAAERMDRLEDLVSIAVKNVKEIEEMQKVRAAKTRDAMKELSARKAARKNGSNYEFEQVRDKEDLNQVEDTADFEQYFSSLLAPELLGCALAQTPQAFQGRGPSQPAPLAPSAAPRRLAPPIPQSQSQLHAPKGRGVVIFPPPLAQAASTASSTSVGTPAAIDDSAAATTHQSFL